MDKKLKFTEEEKEIYKILKSLNLTYELSCKLSYITSSESFHPYSCANFAYKEILFAIIIVDKIPKNLKFKSTGWTILLFEEGSIIGNYDVKNKIEQEIKIKIGFLNLEKFIASENSDINKDMDSSSAPDIFDINTDIFDDLFKHDKHKEKHMKHKIFGNRNPQPEPFIEPRKSIDPIVINKINFLEKNFYQQNKKMRVIHLWGNCFRINYWDVNPQNTLEQKIIASKFIILKVIVKGENKSFKVVENYDN